MGIVIFFSGDVTDIQRQAKDQRWLEHSFALNGGEIIGPHGTTGQLMKAYGIFNW